MNKFDCDRFVRGAEEIDRKRAVIKRIISVIESLLNVDWKKSGTFLSTKENPTAKLSLSDDLCMVVVNDHGSFNVGVLDATKNPLARLIGLGSTSKHRALPINITLAVYPELSHIIEEIDARFPCAGIAEHFDFFCKQVDA